MSVGNDVMAGMLILGQHSCLSHGHTGVQLQSDVLHRRKIYSEEKAKFVATVWGTYLNAALGI